MSKDATIGVPAASAEASGAEPEVAEDETVATVYTHDGEDWVPKRLEPGETTSVRTADGRPVVYVEVDEEIERQADDGD